MTDPQIVKLEEIYAAQSISDIDRIFVLFAMAKVSEDLGDIRETFKHLSAANTLKKRLPGYNIKEDRSSFSQIKSSGRNVR